jgi:hypothetical protein
MAKDRQARSPGVSGSDESVGGLKKVLCGMEPTANDHKPLGEHWIGCGQQVVLGSGVAATGASPNQTSFPGIVKMRPAPEVHHWRLPAAEEDHAGQP